MHTIFSQTVSIEHTHITSGNNFKCFTIERIIGYSCIVNRKYNNQKRQMFVSLFFTEAVLPSQKCPTTFGHARTIVLTLEQLLARALWSHLLTKISEHFTSEAALFKL